MHYYILFDENFDTAMELVQTVIDTYENSGYRIDKVEQDRGGIAFFIKFDNGHSLSAIDVTQEWAVKAKKRDKVTLMIDETIDGEMMKGIIRKLGLTNYVYQFTMFNGEEE